MTPHPKAAGYPYDPFAPDALRGTQLYLRSQLQWMRMAPIHPNKSSNLHPR
jgi:hypothetical protein